MTKGMSTWHARARAFIAVPLVLSAASVGCASVDDPQSGGATPSPTVRSVEDARAGARDLSSTILDLSGVQGRVSEPGPRVTTCEEDPEKERLYKIRHSWSISETSGESLAAGMDRLRMELPQEGWTIIEDGELNNAERSPRVLFENADVEYAANIQLEGQHSDAPLLVVTLVSACFSTPEGESPRGEF
ncbi:hypothetical protein [Streptomyces millisiae]|uniref:Lipoprotein n=1 Tax=Streptomyces millisiae TaxID=3075542 RepID=A0ABU2LVB6_9ACTN|nr:hypothetical protein [Streptomyces sp. DSM 44918]MDT0321546.1 hypothetical protein [Streptomyces sp. DSM 44918]